MAEMAGKYEKVPRSRNVPYDHGIAEPVLLHEPDGFW
jgi:hypothetical protein